EIYTVVFLSLERYVAIRWPLKATRLCSVGRTKRGLVVIVVLSGIFKLPNFIFDYRTLKWHPECQNYRLDAVFIAASWYATFKLVYVQLLDQVCSFIIPLSLLVFLNFGLIFRIFPPTKKYRYDTWNNGKILTSEALAISSDSSAVKYKIPMPDNGMTVLRTYSFRTRRNMSTKARRTTDHKSANNEEPVRQTDAVFREKNGHGSIAGSEFHPGSRNINSNNRSILLTLVGVVTIFLICETPTTLCFLVEMWDLLSGIWKKNGNSTTSLAISPIFVTTEDLYYYAYPAALVLVLVGCASNFFIYILIGRRFRRNCKQVVINLAKRICCCAQKTNEEAGTRLLRSLGIFHRNQSLR
uniref:G_PROTEIN_RECEP_F1_2 domain-containing protein n=1 Tax=Mesocestoides corti TaxID=53468 RepID=A0A5K3FQX9_MESCO